MVRKVIAILVVLTLSLFAFTGCADLTKMDPTVIRRV